MRVILLIFSLLFSFGRLAAQEDSGIVVMPVADLAGIKSFTYRLITQQYIANENGYFLDIKIDTVYLKFTRTDKPLTYRAERSTSDTKKIPVVSEDTFQEMPLEIEFYPSGKVKQLINWKAYRDIFVSSASAHVRQGTMSTDDFDKALKQFNDETYVRRLVMQDINYVFHLFGDTFNTAIEYLRVKAIRSPFPISGFDYYIEGNLKLEKPEGGKNSIVFTAQNKAGAAEKPLLMAEARAYQKETSPPGEPMAEITSVGLNSEQSFTYNSYQKRMMNITLSDVVAIGYSSRGNIRIFDFWDFQRD